MTIENRLRNNATSLRRVTVTVHVEDQDLVDDGFAGTSRDLTMMRQNRPERPFTRSQAPRAQG